ncbi:MAG: hypothetical protein U9P90_01550 [Patescibacteria group bacterium]|nr:hypothetical protein [Patescibacteria group bacterium]
MKKIFIYLIFAIILCSSAVFADTSIEPIPEEPTSSNVGDAISDADEISTAPQDTWDIAILVSGVLKRWGYDSLVTAMDALFLTPTEGDAAYEAEIDDSAGLKSALSDELDGGSKAVFADSFATGAADNGVMPTKGYVDDNSGGVDSGTDPTTTSSTMAIDTNDHQIIVNDLVYASENKLIYGAIPDIDNQPSSVIPLFHFASEVFPFGVTITNFNITNKDLASSGSNYRFMAEKWSAASGGTADAHVADMFSAEADFGTTLYQYSTAVFNVGTVPAGGKIKLDINDTDWAAEDFDMLDWTLTFTVTHGD